MRQRRLWVIVAFGMTLLVVGVMLQAVGCGPSVEDVNTAIGACDEEQDDDNECTDISCADGGVFLTNSPDGKACTSKSGNRGTCSDGTCKLDCLDIPTTCKCKNAIEDCPLDSCRTATCSASGFCELLLTDDKTPCTIDGGENGVCENGFCVECIDDQDCPGGLAGYCYNSQCASCSNGVQDGDETAIDCGSVRCGLCNGASCQGGPSTCNSGTCADGLCCESVCLPCMMCNLPGKEGSCVNVPAGNHDTECNAANKACDGAGVCQTGTPNGSSCAQNSNCISQKCINGICVEP
jgi:hypothetical protein